MFLKCEHYTLNNVHFVIFGFQNQLFGFPLFFMAKMCSVLEPWGVWNTAGMHQVWQPRCMLSHSECPELRQKSLGGPSAGLSSQSALHWAPVGCQAEPLLTAASVQGENGRSEQAPALHFCFVGPITPDFARWGSLPGCLPRVFITWKFTRKTVCLTFLSRYFELTCRVCWLFFKKLESKVCGNHLLVR